MLEESNQEEDLEDLKHIPELPSDYAIIEEARKVSEAEDDNLQHAIMTVLSRKYPDVLTPDQRLLKWKQLCQMLNE